MNKPALFFISLIAACLCSSQAGVPDSDFEHLFKGAPIIVGSKGAWLIHEPRVISTGQNGRMIFGPGKDEAVITVRESARRSLLQISGEDGPQPPKIFGEGIFVVNLVSGAKRQIFSPTGGLKFSSLDWVSKRILMASGAGPDWAGSILIDALTGSSLPLESSLSRGLIISEVPHFAVLRDTSERTSTGATKVQIEIIDFSSSPPARREFDVSLLGINAYLYTNDHTIICRTGRDSFAELSLATGESKPWEGDPATLYMTEEGNLPGESYPPREISSTIRSGKDGGLWVGEDVQMPAMTASVERQTQRPTSLRPMMQISKDSDFALMDGWGQKVLFRSLGTAYVLDLTKVDLEAAKKALMMAARTKAINFAKQAGTAGMMYAADYDDYLPLSGAQAKDAVNPYLRDSEILNSVIWSNLTGQNISAISDPANYELGYVPGPGGRAIIFADGSVRWRPIP